VTGVDYNAGWTCTPNPQGGGITLTATGEDSDAVIRRDPPAGDVQVQNAPAGTQIVVSGTNAAVNTP
jgi:hypothetical protein